MPFKDLTDKDLEHVSQVLWDDWNFGSGSDRSYNLLQFAIKEVQRRKSEPKAEEIDDATMINIFRKQYANHE